MGRTTFIFLVLLSGMATSLALFFYIQSGFRRWLLAMAVPPLLCMEADPNCDTICLLHQSKHGDGAYWDATSTGLACRKVVAPASHRPTCKHTALIVASAFTTLQSPYDGGKERGTVRDLRNQGVLDFVCPFYRSAVEYGIELIVMHDRKDFSQEAALEHCRPEDFGRKASPSTVVSFFFYPADPSLQAQDARFFAAEALLESRLELDCVMLSDGRDVVVKADPRPVLSMAAEQGRLILQLDSQETADVGLSMFFSYFLPESKASQLHPEAIESSKESDPDLVAVGQRVREWAAVGFEYLSAPGARSRGTPQDLLPRVINCGLIGGLRDNVHFFLQHLNLVLSAFQATGKQPVDWPAANYVVAMVLGSNYIGLEVAHALPALLSQTPPC